MLKYCVLIVLSVLMLSKTQAQNDVLNNKINVKVKNETLETILQLIEKQANVSFSYSQKLIPKGKFNLNVKNEELSIVLTKLLAPHKLEFSILYGNYIIIHKVQRTEYYTVSGYVYDELTGEKLIGVTVYNPLNLKSTRTNQDGYYSLTLKKDSVKLVYSIFPYESKIEKFLLDKNTNINLELTQSELAFPVFKVTSRPDNQIYYQPDYVKLNQRTLSQLPVLFGETDVMKALQLLPGVSSGNDGTIGLNIRGGGADQNLILLDDVPLYNPSHIYGFFSVFNSDVIKNVSLMKGGISSQYSGRLSSVIDVRTIDGNNKKLRAQVSIGVISSKLALDGPIGKSKKTSFVLAARRSYLDLLTGITSNVNFANDGSPIKTGYYFYDANGKINHRFNDKHQTSLSFYVGKDILFIRNSFKLKQPDLEIKEKDNQRVYWGNRMFSLRDYHVISPKLSAWLGLSFTNYNFGNNSIYEYSESSDSSQTINKFDYRFETFISNVITSYNTELKLYDWLSIKSGLGYVFHKFDRKISSSDNLLQSNSSDSGNVNANELKAYTDVNVKIRRKFNGSFGFNVLNFNIQGKNYSKYQPRVFADYRLGKGLKLHIGYQQTVQFLHLLTSSNVGIPMDLWLPSTKNILPEVSEMISGGLSYAFGDFVINLEGFNKTMNNVIEYKDQSNYIGSSTNWEEKVAIGKGWAYGYEFQAEKRNGRLKGWVSYTLSWSNRQFDEINQGKIFPYKYDRRHNVAVFANYIVNEKIDFSANWMFSSGANYTLPEQVYYVNSSTNPKNIIYIYGDRNNYQLPYYHRLDFGVNFRKKNKRYSRLLSIGAYNVYNRLNPFYITPSYNDKNERIFEAVSLFPILPSINYKWIF